MENNKRRLLKDLPFGHLKIGDVIWKGGRGHGGQYSISNFNTYYETGGDSSNGIKCFEKNEEEILNTIWDNEEWFEDADINHIDFICKKDEIVLKFKPIDKEEIEVLVKGIIHILPELEKGSYTWNKFKNITTKIKTS